MKNGFTTGSCAAAAGKAAAYMLLGGRRKDHIEIETPAGIRYSPQIEEITMEENSVCCAVRKDSGDDPDITNGILIYAQVSYAPEEPGFDPGDQDRQDRVLICGGAGVGKVTRPGLDQPVGADAINSVPRQMIRREVREVMDLFDYRGALRVVICVPEGERLASHTFNPRLGIEGGISILGTSGIVEPMSVRALMDTIRLELTQVRSLGREIAVISPGNYGLEFMKNQYGYDLDRAVKCSNFIGDTVDMAADAGFKKLLLCGHIGKLIKVSGGIMNTHSREADCRMELMAAAAIACGGNDACARKILSCVTTEEAYDCCLEEGIGKTCMQYIMDRISFYLGRRAAGRLEIQCMVYSNRFGLLGMTKEAEAFLAQAKEN